MYNYTEFFYFIGFPRNAEFVTEKREKEERPWAQASTWEKLPGAGLNNFRYTDRTRVNIS